ncbi:peptide ABC transporter permease [Rathayibacter sp. AY1C4]|uniref:FtsX-like permease family protein n=1 Tax=Rathayibacter sp. AY1C4 TaxID=2080537 RepID=UPI000CE7FF03|nr:FtsX-like permease family protein [Rathayibacter sp. AY1C4]PPH19654.1 peptide ABC transporter permease [Rathayibacter sp. AY1C4]
MSRYVVRLFADEWRRWSPAIAVVALMATLIGLCVQQFAWTGDPAFTAAVTAAGVALGEFRILSITIYTVVALVGWVALTIVGRASVLATGRTHALWLLLGASRAQVFVVTLLVLGIVSLLGAGIGALLSTMLAFWAVPAFNGAVSSEVDLPSFSLAPWAPVVTLALGTLTALAGGVLPARRAARTPPSAALREVRSGRPGTAMRAVRIGCGIALLLIASGLVTASASARELGATGPAPMFNLAVDVGGSVLVAVYLLCPEVIALVFRALHALSARSGLVVAALGIRAAAARVQVSTATIAPLTAGLGAIAVLLCAVESVVAMTTAVRPGTRADLTDVLTIVAVVAVSMLATSATVVALSAQNREREIALLQAAGLQRRQIIGLVVSESLAMSLAASTAAAAPVAATGAVCWLVSRAALGEGVVIWPVPSVVLGLIGSWIVLSLILLIPAQARLRRPPGPRLREQGV